MNCTASAPHIGCLAVTDFHIESLISEGYTIKDIEYADCGWQKLWKGSINSSLNALEDSRLLKRIRANDTVVINGEGTLHNSAGAGMLIVAKLAKREGKKVYLVNTSAYHLGESAELLKSIDRINIREMRSSKYLKSKNIDHDVILDSLLGANFNNIITHDYQGRVIVMDWHPNRDRDVGKSLLPLVSDDSMDFLPLNHYVHLEDWRSTVANIRTADLVVTGRYHGVYLAGLAGVPFVTLPSNTDKIQGLLDATKLPLKVTSIRDINKDIDLARNNKSLYKEFSHYLYSQLPLQTFAALIDGSPSGQVKPTDGEKQERINEVENRMALARRTSQMKQLQDTITQRVGYTGLKYIKDDFRKTIGRLKRNISSIIREQ